MIGILFLVSIGAFAEIVTLRCGKKVQTVGIDYFDGNEAEYIAWIEELERIYCGPISLKPVPVGDILP